MPTDPTQAPAPSNPVSGIGERVQSALGNDTTPNPRDSRTNPGAVIGAAANPLIASFFPAGRAAMEDMGGMLAGAALTRGESPMDTMGLQGAFKSPKLMGLLSKLPGVSMVEKIAHFAQHTGMAPEAVGKSLQAEMKQTAKSVTQELDDIAAQVKGAMAPGSRTVKSANVPKARWGQINRQIMDGAHEETNYRPRVGNKKFSNRKPGSKDPSKAATTPEARARSSAAGKKGGATSAKNVAKRKGDERAVEMEHSPDGKTNETRTRQERKVLRDAAKAKKTPSKSAKTPHKPKDT